MLLFKPGSFGRSGTGACRCPCANQRGLCGCALVDPDNPGNVGLLDQRHDRSVIANIWGLIRKPFIGGNKQLEAPNAGGTVN